MADLSDLGRRLIDLQLVTPDQWAAAMDQTLDPATAEVALDYLGRVDSWWSPPGDPTPAVTPYQSRQILDHLAAGEPPEALGPRVRWSGYLVLELLAVDGFSETVKGWCLGTRKYAALKAARPNADPQTAAHLARAADLHAGLDHPNLVRLLAREPHAGGEFYAHEFVPGPDVHQFVTRAGAPVGWQAVAGWAAGLLSALDHLAGNNPAGKAVVHRDVKPRNVLLQPRPGGGHAPRLLGFDLAIEVVPGADFGSSARSATGTPAYMAPEQWLGADRTGPAADLYALGGTLHFALTGRPPFDPTGFVELMRSHANDPPPSVRARRPDVPAEFDALVRRMMAKDPAARGTAAELRGEFLRLANGTAPPPADPFSLCARCGAAFNFDGNPNCPACRYAATLTGPVTPPGVPLTDWNLSPPPARVRAQIAPRPAPSPDPGTQSVLGSSPPPPPPEDSQEVQRLLDQIAAQSHFEERYRIGDELARGGMGVILKGYDLILRRDVAIKMMRRERPAPDDGAVRGQFLKEARVGGRLLHPNVLPVFDLGVNREGHIYYTMRLVDGVNLKECLDALSRGVSTKFIDFPLRRLVDAFCAVCQGIDFAHENHVIHLDLKPQNVLVSGFSEVFVIDWGLARVDDEDDTERLADLYRSHRTPNDPPGTGTFAPPTPDRRVVGTPPYMAPEQADGRVDLFKPTTDVYGLGGILHYILYGQPPNRGNTAIEMLAASSLRKSRQRLRSGIVPRGRRVRPEHLDAIRKLEDICLKALEPDTAHRYPDADAMLIELNEWRMENPTPPGV